MTGFTDLADALSIYLDLFNLKLAATMRCHKPVRDDPDSKRYPRRHYISVHDAFGLSSKPHSVFWTIHNYCEANNLDWAAHSDSRTIEIGPKR